MPSRATRLGRVAAIPCPAKRIVPALGCTTPSSMLNSVVLPAPLGPMMPTISPVRMLKLTSSTARTPP